MKIAIKAKEASRPTAPRATVKALGSSAGPSKKPAWLVTGVSDIRRAEQEAAVLSGKNRPPELWIKDGEKRLIRCRDAGPLGMIWRYTLQSGGKFASYTAPPQGSPDLLRRAGQTPSLRGVYEVIDRTGYITKENKRRKDYPVFWVVNQAVNKMLEAIITAYGSLANMDLMVSRSGTGRQTTYAILPCPPAPLPASLRGLPRLSAEMARYYAPPSQEEQEMILVRSGHGEYEDVGEHETE